MTSTATTEDASHYRRNVPLLALAQGLFMTVQSMGTVTLPLAALAMLDQQSTTLQRLQGMAHRLARHAEHLGNTFLGDPRAGAERAVDNGIDEPVLDLFDENRLNIDLHHRHDRPPSRSS